MGSPRNLKTGWRAICLAIAAFMTSPSSMAGASESAWQANDDDALLFDLRLGKYRLGDGVRGYQKPNAVCVNFDDIIRSFDLAIKISPDKSKAQGWAFDEMRALSIERTTQSITLQGRRQALPGDAIVDTREGWCVDTVELSRWLGIQLHLDQANALILVHADHMLPVERMLERRARAASFRPHIQLDENKLPQAVLPYRMWRTPALDAVVTLNGTHDRQRGAKGNRSVELYAAGEIARASVDARLSTDTHAKPSSLRLRGYRMSLGGKLLGPLGATYLAVGDVSSYGSPLVAQAMPGRGVAVTNRLLDQPDIFDRTSLHGELPQGWDAELYRNDQLLQFAQPRSDGRYEFLDVPLLYGLNSLEVVSYGPQGQIRRDRKLINVGMDNPPPGKLRYTLSFSQDNHDLVTVKNQSQYRDQGWRGSAGLEIGLGLRTSLAVQVHNLLVDDQRVSFVEGSIRRAIGPALLEMSAAAQRDGGYAGRVQLVGAFGRSFVAAESIISHDIKSDRIERSTTGTHNIALDHALALGNQIVPLHLDARYTTRTTGINSLDLSSRISRRFRGLMTTGEFGWHVEKNRSGPSPPERLDAGLLLAGRYGKIRLRGEVRWQLSPNSRFESANIAADWQSNERQGWRVGLGYDHSLSRARTAIGYTHRFDRFALSATGEFSTDRSVAAGLNLAFSLGRNPTGHGLRLTSEKQATLGSVVTRVFRDTNNDGSYQAGEPLEPGVKIAIGKVPTSRSTGMNGLATINSLTPFQPVLIGIEGASLADPHVQPKGPGMIVTPRPGIDALVDIPLVSTGEVDGMLVRAGGGPLEGVDIELVTSQGTVQAITRSEYDGFFLFESVPYGKYSLRVAPLSASAARLDTANVQDVAVSNIAVSLHLGVVAIPSQRMTAHTAP